LPDTGGGLDERVVGVLGPADVGAVEEVDQPLQFGGVTDQAAMEGRQVVVPLHSR